MQRVRMERINFLGRLGESGGWYAECEMHELMGIVDPFQTFSLDRIVLDKEIDGRVEMDRERLELELGRVGLVPDEGGEDREEGLGRWVEKEIGGIGNGLWAVVDVVYRIPIDVQ